MSEKVVFWYGCNVVRHGDIIHGSIEILRALGHEVAPVGGPGYCCGTSKDANLRAADGMARRTVGKFNELTSRLAGDVPPAAAAAAGQGATAGAAKVVTWCPSCHRHMNQFMGDYTDPQFPMAHFAQIVHAGRERLRERLVHPVKRRVVLHRHFGFREVDVNPLVEDLLRHQATLEPVCKLADRALQMDQLLIEIGAQPHQFLRIGCGNAVRHQRADQFVMVHFAMLAQQIEHLARHGVRREDRACRDEVDEIRALRPKLVDLPAAIAVGERCGHWDTAGLSHRL